MTVMIADLRCGGAPTHSHSLRFRGGKWEGAPDQANDKFLTF